MVSDDEKQRRRSWGDGRRSFAIPPVLKANIFVRVPFLNHKLQTSSFFRHLSNLVIPFRTGVSIKFYYLILTIFHKVI